MLMFTEHIPEDSLTSQPCQPINAKSWTQSSSCTPTIPPFNRICHFSEILVIAYNPTTSFGFGNSARQGNGFKSGFHPSFASSSNVKIVLPVISVNRFLNFLPNLAQQEPNNDQFSRLEQLFSDNPST